jgi:hypothetical protein
MRLLALLLSFPSASFCHSAAQRRNLLFESPLDSEEKSPQ